MAWEEPRTWQPGEQGIPSHVMNQHSADNLQFLFDNYTNINGIYKDLDSVAIPSASAYTEIVSLTLASRHEALLLTIIGNFPAGSLVQYRIDTNPDLEILNFAAATGYSFVAKQWIIPSLVTGEHTVRIDAQGSGSILSFQADVRELT